MNVCRVCTCTDNSPCFVDDKGQSHTFESLAVFSDDELEQMTLVPCHWVEWNLCSACVQRPAPAPLLFGPDGRPLRGTP